MCRAIHCLLYTLIRFGEFGLLKETLTQRFAYSQSQTGPAAAGRLDPSAVEGQWEEAGSVTSRGSKQMMISALSLALGDVEGDWRAGEQLLGLCHTSVTV